MGVAHKTKDDRKVRRKLDLSLHFPPQRGKHVASARNISRWNRTGHPSASILGRNRILILWKGKGLTSSSQEVERCKMI